jgi:LEA14-like dessication related protein
MVIDIVSLKRAVAGMVLLAVLSCGGCMSAPRTLESPHVQLVGLALLGMSAESQRFLVDLEVANPNNVRIPVAALSFSVRIAGSGVMSGRTVESFTLMPGEAQTVQLEVTADLVSSVSRLLSLLQGPTSTIPYDLDGLVTLSRGLRPTFPFSRRGEVPLALPPELR